MGAEPSAPDRMNRFQKLTLATAGTTIVLFAVGGLVRGTGSGLGCSTWPACEPGQLFPSGTVHSLIEFSHRALVFVASALILWTAIEAFRRYRSIPSLFWPAVAAIPLVLGQAVLGGVVVHTDLDPGWVTVHFAVALGLVADVTFLATRAYLMDRPPGSERAPDRGFARLTWATTGALAALLLVGTYVRARDAGLAFTDWPLLGGRLVPGLDGYTTPMFLHRLLAAVVFLLVVWIAIRARTAAARSPELVRLSTVLLTLFVGQILSGAANVWSRLRPWAVVLHVALSVLIWATMVAMATVADRLARTAPETAGERPGASPGGSIRERVTAYVRLTKPRIIVLLLITTVPAMILAANGVPPVGLMLATLVGGTIAAGSANAINMYLDRDIDEMMRRTRQRPLPAHAVTPAHALRFGFVLGAVAFYFLAITVNVLAASLALSAIAFYVFVYTMWLKRSSPQNIVIGGAAGAVPALVGWAAVTGTVALPAWILFAIVFVWTPPHFWALSMRFRGDYAAAGVPMLPVVRGEDETRRQIFLYSLLLFGVTLILVPVGGMGPVYLLTALILGGSFVYRSLRLWRDGGDALAWRLFKYSIVYLAALFGAVAVDAIVS
ncbi:MAG TPA: heme o synthase [Actinomycetota bacterium]|jgi:protoheme IX farnesyltransferase